MPQTRGGARKGAGRPSLPDSDRRKTLNVRVKTETSVWLHAERERFGLSMGELVDIAIELLQEHPDILISLELSKSGGVEGNHLQGASKGIQNGNVLKV